MKCFQNLSIEHWLTIISIVLALGGYLLVFCQWKKSIIIRRAEFINQIIEKLRFDERLSKIMYDVEYNNNWYGDKFHQSALEQAVDNYFSYLDYICYLKRTGNISDEEFEIFKYIIHRACKSSSSKKYLWNLFQFSKKNNAPCSFQYLIDYGIESASLPKDFKENKGLYDKTLNWE